MDAALAILESTNQHTYFQAPIGATVGEGIYSFLLPGRAVKWNGIPMPWSPLLIHNGPTTGFPWTSADMPSSAQTGDLANIQGHKHVCIHICSHTQQKALPTATFRCSTTHLHPHRDILKTTWKTVDFYNQSMAVMSVYYFPSGHDDACTPLALT